MSILIVVLVVLTIFVWRGKSKNSKLNTVDQSVVSYAQRLVDIINESLQIANDSKVVDTKLSRLDLAKSKLDELKKLSVEKPFIKIPTLLQVEQSISSLEQEFHLANYREIAEGNMRGQALEKEGQVDEAILEYERLLDDGVDTPFTYRRLAIIYSKSKKAEDELRVLRAAIQNVPVENSAHYQWFAERLAKKSQV